MSLRALINFADVEKSIIGINILFARGGQVSYAYCVLVKSKNILEMKLQGCTEHRIAMLSAIRPFLEKGVRVHLNINGKGVLTKEIDGTSHSEPQIAVIFPGVKKEDFIHQTFRGEESAFISVIRKDVVEEYALYPEIASNVIGVSFGPFIADGLRPLCSSDIITADESIIEFGTTSIRRVRPSEDKSPDLVIGSETVSSGNVLAYAAALHILVPSSRLTQLPLDSVSLSRETFESKRRIFYAGRAALVSTLAVLIVNTLFYFPLSSEIAALHEGVSSYKTVMATDASANKKAREIEKEFAVLGWESNLEPLLVGDQLAATVPAEIQLSSLEIGVADELVYRREKRHVFESNLVKVNGVANNASVASDWIAAVEKLAWVEKVQQENYRHDSKSGKGFFNFIIQTK